MGNPTYLIILVLFFLIAFVLQKSFQLKLFRNKKHAVCFFLTILVVGVLWDSFSTWQKIWIFPQGGTIGVNIGLLPIEEYLFFLDAGYFGITVFRFFELQS